MNVPSLLLLRIFGLLASSLLLWSQRFGQYVLRFSSGASCRIQESRTNPFTWTTGADCSKTLRYSKYFLLFLPVVEIEPTTSRWFHSETLFYQTPYPLKHVSLSDNSRWLLEILTLMSPSPDLCSPVSCRLIRVLKRRRCQSNKWIMCSWKLWSRWYSSSH